MKCYCSCRRSKYLSRYTGCLNDSRRTNSSWPCNPFSKRVCCISVRHLHPAVSQISHWCKFLIYSHIYIKLSCFPMMVITKILQPTGFKGSYKVRGNKKWLACKHQGLTFICFLHNSVGLFWSQPFLTHNPWPLLIFIGASFLSTSLNSCITKSLHTA